MNLPVSAPNRSRRVLALGLLLVILFPFFGSSVSSKQLPTDTSPLDEHFLLYEAPNGDTVCRLANAAERLELNKARPSGLRRINHLNDEFLIASPGENNTATRLTIILNATDQLNSPNGDAPLAKAAFIRAAAQWESRINSPMTIYLEVDFGTTNFGAPWPAGVLGSTSSTRGALLVDYPEFRNHLVNGANTPAKLGAYDLLPQSSIPTDKGSFNQVIVSGAVARATGVLPPIARDPIAAGGDPTPRIGFNSNTTLPYDFDRTNGISGRDFEAVAIHEIGHALGFVSRSGATTEPQQPTVWDLYRFRSGMTSGNFPTAQRIMTHGGPAPNSQYHFVPGETEVGLSDGGPDGVETNNADGNQSSHWRQQDLNNGIYIGIMDPRLPAGIQRDITPIDINALEIFGYNNNLPPPPANDDFASAQVLNGCSGSVNGTNVGASREIPEPNHSPDNGGGSRSVWYRWQAPQNVDVTFDTGGSEFDTVLAVYRGDVLDGTLVAIMKHDDNSTNDKDSTVEFPAVAGVTYRVAVDGYNNGGAGGDQGPIKLNWSAENCAGSTVQFSSATYNVSEGGNSLSVQVNRSGSVSGTAEVSFTTMDSAGLASCQLNNNVASERCDYATTVGTLRFAAGETSKTFIIPIVNDVLVEGNETFQVLLRLPSGTTLGSPSVASVTINENDSTPASQNPIDGVEFFVTQQYIDFLGRLPDSIGLANWMATLGGCPNGGFGEFDNPHCDRVHVSSGFFLSVEFQQRGYFAYKFYEVALDRRPTYAEFVPDMAQVGGAQSPESEVLSKAAYTNAWTERPEFKTRYDGLSNSAYVNTLEANAEVTLSNKQALIDALNASQKNRGQVLREIVELNSVGNQFFNRAFVSMQYFGYLRRDPDTVGFQNWLNTLNADPSNFRHMIFGFLFSTEYRQRFGP